MVSAISNDQSDLLKLFMSNLQSSKSSDSASESILGSESTEKTDSFFSAIFGKSDESSSVEDQVYEMLTDITKNMGVPAGMFIEDASEEETESTAIKSTNTSSVSLSGSSSTYDIRDTNQDGVVSTEELQEAMSIIKNGNSDSSKLVKQLEQAYGLSEDETEPLLSLVI